ncbi:MAG: tRNA dihydrouridine synthase DusB [Pseudomonadota bacterium]
MIGPIKARNRVLAAPLSGVSDLPFRQRTWAGGAGLVVSEMIASQEFCQASNQSIQRALSKDCGPIMLQLAGRNAHWMEEAAKIAETGGAQIIDINMGCPAKKVTGGASGSALMRDLDHAMTLVEATVAAVKVPVTLKMRLGWDETSINAPELARRAQDAGVQMITVHGRTRCQFYEGNADWSEVRAVRDVIDIPLVVNGDITSLSAANKAIELSGADAVMVGRIAYGAPWAVGGLAKQSAAAEPKPEQAEFDIANYVKAHYAAMIEHYGERVGVRHARKHLNWYIERHLGAGTLVSPARRALMATTDTNEAFELIAQLFGAETRVGEAA